ncbi:MAG: sigma-70 family RNA polymerase sigma factor [Pyrinomonadaceae bacterium]|nr:sigma-70 family RNA polymerase sigma factor [Pyrinomonadaceae bacterium]
MTGPLTKGPHAGRTMTLSESITIDDDAIACISVPSQVEVVGLAEEVGFVDKLRAGDAEAFGNLVDRYSDGIYALLYRLTDSPEEAADLTQDTFLKALRSIRQFRGDAHLKTWLYRIAVNESRNRFRWWKRRRRDLTISLDETVRDTDVPLSTLIADEGPTPEEVALSREREYALSVALSELGPVFREAVVLVDVEGLSYEEAAAVIGVGIGTVKSRISRGREELRRRLSGF